MPTGIAQEFALITSTLQRVVVGWEYNAGVEFSPIRGLRLSCLRRKPQVAQRTIVSLPYFLIMAHCAWWDLTKSRSMVAEAQSFQSPSSNINHRIPRGLWWFDSSCTKGISGWHLEQRAGWSNVTVVVVPRPRMTKATFHGPRCTPGVTLRPPCTIHCRGHCRSNTAHSSGGECPPRVSRSETE